MQKQNVAYQVVEPIHSPAAPAPTTPNRARPDLRLATVDDVGVEGPARRLQHDIARAFAPASTWSVRRTVIFAAAFHIVVLGALALAASEQLLSAG